MMSRRGRGNWRWRCLGTGRAKGSPLVPSAEEEGGDRLPQGGDRFGLVDGNAKVRAAIEAAGIPGGEGPHLVDRPSLPAARRRVGVGQTLVRPEGRSSI